MATPEPLLPRHWVYVDAERTHELHAEVEPRPSRLVTTEFPAGSRDPAEAVQSARQVDGEAEVRRLLAEVEQRLRLAGTYFRAEVGGGAQQIRWTPLGPAEGPAPDLRAIELPIPEAAKPGASMSFHHFHAPEGGDRLLIGMPRLDVQQDRHVLAELQFTFPRVEEGALRVLHARLAPPTLRTSIIREHLDAPRAGFRKLLEPRDYATTFGPKWLDDARHVFRAAARRLVGAGPQGDGTLLQRHRGDDHPLAPDLRRALDAPRLRSLLRRYVAPHEAERALAGGEHTIRRLIQTKRRSFPHTESYELSIAEAALLLTFGLDQHVNSLVDEEATKLLRYVGGYR